ncbi:ribonuclease T [Lysobacter solisilvae]|uniref:Ribonuclease T n=1 Tax=Agrilutibacter solisilvae TaxID=2763317 RepID=A0A974Y3R3_9GAMM|nr:ribonuclease T [Lysobacter solisilvae]
MPHSPAKPALSRLATRFRGFLPVVVDVETGGFDWNKHALLEIAVAPIDLDEAGQLIVGPMTSTHVQPAPGTQIDPKSLEITGIVLDHPFLDAKPERVALDLVFAPVREALKKHGCQRAILVGHNAHFDLNFLNAAIARCNHKRSPFHPFSVFDTVTLAGVAYGQTVLSRALQAAGLEWDTAQAHSAVYDTERTAQLFCRIVNAWGTGMAALGAPADSAPETAVATAQTPLDVAAAADAPLDALDD